MGSNVTAITQASNSSPLTISTGMLTVNSGGTTLAASGTALFTVSGGVGGSGNLILNTNNNTNGITLSGTAINNTGAMINSGIGSATTTISAVIGPNVNGVTQTAPTSTLNLTGINTYTGNTTITLGTLQIGSAGTLGSGSYAGSIANSGTLQYGSSAANALSGIISGTGTLAMTDGTLTLSGSNTYSGVTTINAGKVILSSAGSLGNTAMSVANGATFAVQPGMGGSIAVGGAAGALNLANGAAFNMTGGNSAGTLNLTGTLGIGNGSEGANLNFDLGTNGGTTVSDLLQASGAATIHGTNTIGIVGFRLHEFNARQHLNFNQRARRPEYRRHFPVCRCPAV